MLYVWNQRATISVLLTAGEWPVLVKAAIHVSVAERLALVVSSPPVAGDTNVSYPKLDVRNLQGGSRPSCSHGH